MAKKVKQADMRNLTKNKCCDPQATVFSVITDAHCSMVHTAQGIITDHRVVCM
jgi:hypothetical protein